MTDRALQLRLSTGRTIALRERWERENAPVLPMLHGLGDDSTAWEIFLEDDDFLPEWNLIVPDLPGYGGTPRSARGIDPFTDMVRMLCELMHDREVTRVTLLLHSMGGVVGSLFAHSSLQTAGRQLPASQMRFSDAPVNLQHGAEVGVAVDGIINIEGNLTRQDTFLSGKAVQADESGKFDRWLAGFTEAMVRSERPSDRRYASAILACERPAFIAGARALVEWSCAADDHNSWCGKVYRELPLPKLYIAGEGSIPDDSLKWLKESGLEYSVVKDAGHAVMNDEPEITAKLISSHLKSWAAETSTQSEASAEIPTRA